MQGVFIAQCINADHAGPHFLVPGIISMSRRRRGCKSAHMLVAKDNVKALRSYAKLAFEKVGEYVLQGHDYWCFEKKL